jgi:ubiquinone/menaquinone biosynthesis C-methylase UbiE
MSFDRLAPHYSWMERLLAGDKLHRCRTAFLDEARAARKALLLGEGHGKFLVELRSINSDAEIWCVEESAGMIRAARERLARRGLNESGIHFLQGRAEEIIPDFSVDLAASHFFLDCFPADTVAKLVGTTSRILSENGVWLLSDFQVPSTGWRKVRARVVLAVAYRFFWIATRLPARSLAAPQPFFRESGLRLDQRKEFNFGLLYAELWRKRRIQ